MKLLKPIWADRFPDLVAGQTTRESGVSKSPFSSLNFSVAVGDRPAEVQKNQTLLMEALGFETSNLVGGHQVHGDEIEYATAGGRHNGCDAFITDRAGLLLGVTAADCVPILIADVLQKIVAAAHAGWRGTVANIAAKTVKKLKEDFNSKPENCWAFIGAAICFEDYEVGREVAEHFRYPFVKKLDKPGKFLVDLKGSNKQQLIDEGLPESQIDVCPISTFSRSDLLFSHRAAGGKPTGRGLAFIGYKKAAA
ncbi:MAG: peptidoglycan editing factor PgeF [Bacteroidota bacterium]